MLEYDEWAVPGEVEYAEKKAAEIEAQLRKLNKNDENSCLYCQVDMRIQITEHVAEVFETKCPKYWIDWQYDITDKKLINYYKSRGGCIDEPKVFDLPADDIRSNLPEWDESLLPDASLRDIMRRHSIRYMTTNAIEYLEGDYDGIKDEFHFSDAKCDRIMETFVKKLSIKNKLVVFTELEEKIADYIKYYGSGYSYYDDYSRCDYEPWYFPLAMSEDEIIDAIHEAYSNARIKSKRRIPDKLDYTNISYWSHYYDVCRIENYECLFQGKGGDMIIRFLFDFKNMKIVMAYPVYKQSIEKKLWY